MKSKTENDTETTGENKFYFKFRATSCQIKMQSKFSDNYIFCSNSVSSESYGLLQAHYPWAMAMPWKETASLSFFIFGLVRKKEKRVANIRKSQTHKEEKKIIS